MRTWSTGQEDFTGPEGRTVLLQADKVQAGRQNHSKHRKQPLRGGQEYGVAMDGKASNVAAVEIRLAGSHGK